MTNVIPDKAGFDYELAFSRNIGLLTRAEQRSLRDYKIAIAGLGGVGGNHLIGLIRQGFVKFVIADMDNYSIENFNRQYGAEIDTLGEKKSEVMVEKALNINPNCDIEVYDCAINRGNLESFLDGVDLAIDGIDAFNVKDRRDYINHAHSKNIPVISAGPIGFGTAYLVFDKKSPNFDKYFGVDENTSEEEMMLSFALGLMPKMLQKSYMKKINLKQGYGPSSIAGINFATGAVVSNAIKILLERGTVKSVPWVHQYDCYEDKLASVKRTFYGKRDPLRRLKIAIGKRLLNQ
ncbi:MAG: ThiF family adenylyltransferase [Candidatus Pacearchaeota archaeon]|jgi:molybdopterin/thiamine biosynthesis adenylyltransferase